jgi:hypothetical protein
MLATCYGVALRLSEIDIADNCPFAPAHTTADLHLQLLSQKLRHLADEAKQASQREPLIIHLDLILLTDKTTVSGRHKVMVYGKQAVETGYLRCTNVLDS